MSKLEKFLLLVNATIYVCVAIFSFAYVDLNLTLSKNPNLLGFVNSMQYLGYYNRPQANLIYIVMIVATHGFFLANLILFLKRKISKKYLFFSSVINIVILIFAYPYLSSDIFNYMFDARIIFHYHLSPYTHKALDFPNDDWIRFMRWTHRYSPYGPAWLLLSLVPYVLGVGKFTLTLLAFKAFISAFHLANIYLIYQTLKPKKENIRLAATALYALNPLILMEGIINGHNDVVLATFFLLPIYFACKRNALKTLTSIVVGALIKYIPILNLPWYIFYAKIKSFSFQMLLVANLVTMAIFTYLFSSFKISAPFVSSGATQIQFQPWYLFWTLPFVALIANTWLSIFFIALAIGASLRYVPFIYYGDWSHRGTVEFMTIATLAPTFIIGLVFLLYKFAQLTHGEKQK